MPTPAVDQPPIEPYEVEAILELVSRLAGIHQQIRKEMRFCESVALEGSSALLSLSTLPIERAIVELGRLARGAPPSVTPRT